MSTSASSTLAHHCLSSFSAAIREVKPSSCIQKALSLQNDRLCVNNKSYKLCKNVHLVAIGKAAPAMVEGAELVLGPHFVDGIASVPTGTQIPQNLRTKFLTGAENNLPDEQAIQNAEQIERFIQTVKSQDQLILVRSSSID
jgi:glycerate 2-kinase